jgi:hypothetical protein
LELILGGRKPTESRGIDGKTKRGRKVPNYSVQEICPYQQNRSDWKKETEETMSGNGPNIRRKRKQEEEEEEEEEEGGL